MTGSARLILLSGVMRPPRLAPRRSISISVFELRHCLQLILRSVVDGVIGIPISVGFPVVRGGRRSAGGPGRTVGGGPRGAVDVGRRTGGGRRRGACRNRPRRLIR